MAPDIDPATLAATPLAALSGINHDLLAVAERVMAPDGDPESRAAAVRAVLGNSDPETLRCREETFADPSRYQFTPADISHFVKWFGWASPPDHLNNAPDLLQRETWFWVSPEALDALNDSRWHEDHREEAPILLPEDLPSPDGIMVLSKPLPVSTAVVEKYTDENPELVKIALRTVLAIRWTTLSECVLVQPLHGRPLGERLQEEKTVRGDTNLEWRSPPELHLRPDSWRDMERPAKTAQGGSRHTTFMCADSSPLSVTIPGTRIWQWGRRSTSDPAAGRSEEEIAEALAIVRPDLILPLLCQIPEIRQYKHGEPPELITLPDPAETRSLVSLKPLHCTSEDILFGKLLYCLWAYASEPLPANTPRRITRDIPKNRRGVDPATGGLRMLTLRESPDSPVGAAGTRRRPRRHLVRGHWRRHWHPSLAEHRIKWIAPHLRAGRVADPALATAARTVRNVQAPHEHMNGQRLSR